MFLNDTCTNKTTEERKQRSMIIFRRKTVTLYLKNNVKNSNQWLTVPKGIIPDNKTSATDWQKAVRWDNVISNTLRQVYFLKNQ